TGLTLKMGSFKAGLINTTVDIKNLKLFNPPGFKDRLMIDMPRIYVDYDLPAIIKGKIHLTELRLNLREFIVVKNEKGELNINALKVVQAEKKREKPAAIGKGKMPEIEIDSLELKIGKAVYRDYSSGVLHEEEFDLGIDEKYSNITDVYSLVSLVVVRSLYKTSIARLSGFDLGGLEGTLSDTLGTAQKVAGGAAGEVAKGAGDAVSKTAGALTDIFKDTLGSH
ncbi:MAG: hypothetical protein Q7S07_02860, partial [Candidatus Omnitrophota bacterium]|nr:hypothetical protein [Candidatus Omnitrophota bacterium]